MILFFINTHHLRQSIIHCLKTWLIILVILGYPLQMLAQEIPKRTPQMDSLIRGITPLTYSNQFDEAQQLVLDYLDQKDLSPIEIFYGHFMFADLVKLIDKPEKAIDLLLKSKDYLKDVKEQSLFASLIDGNIGECYFNLRDYDNAKKYALSSIKASPDKSFRGSGHAVNNLIVGFSYYKNTDYPTALDYYHRAIEEYKKYGEVCELPLSYMKIASIYREQGLLKKAKKVIDQAINTSDSCKIDHYSMLSRRALLEYYEDLEDYPSAFFLLKKINELKEAIQHEKQKQEIQDLEARYEVRLAKQETLSLKESARIEGLNNQFKTTILITILVALLVILMLVIYILRTRGQRSKLLKRQLQKIALQNKERETLLKEVHHRVKNNLQVITSLLSLQANQMQDPETMEAFNQSQYRINAMAMIHEMLYQSDNLSTIKITDYLNELVLSLVHSIKGFENQITIDLVIPPIYLGLDTAIPLGLLINEVITNALTHGIPDNTPGKLTIHLKQLDTKGFQLNIGDNGTGYPPSINFHNSPSLGLKLMYKLSRQLTGTITVDQSKKGCNYIVTFQELT